MKRTGGHTTADRADLGTLSDVDEALAALLEDSPQPIWIFDRETLRFLMVNNAAIMRYGYSREEFLRMSLPDIRRTEDIPALMEALSHHDEAYLGVRETQHRTKDGRIIEVEVLSHPVVFQGRASRMVIARDITRRKVMEAALSDSEAMYRAIFDNVSLGLGLTDSVGRILTFNSAMIAPGGYSREEALRIGTVRGLFYDQAERKRLVRQAVAQGGLEQEPVRFKRRDGSPYDALMTLRQVRLLGELCWLVIVEDMTERHRAEAALRESEARLRRGIVDAPVPIMIHAEDGEVVVVNERWCELTGYAPSELETVSDWLRLAYKPEDAERIWAKIAPLYAAEYLIEEGEEVIRTRSGERRNWIFRSRPYGMGPDGRRLVISTAVDITERKRVEDALRKSESLFRLMAENAQDAVFRFRPGPAPEVEYLSPAITKLIGYTPEELRANPLIVLESLHPDDRDFMLKALAEPDSAPTTHTLRWIHRNGEMRWTEQRITIVRDETGTPVAVEGIARDVTESRRAEERVRRLLEQQVLINVMTLVLGEISELERLYEATYLQVRAVMDTDLFILSFYDRADQRIRAGYAVQEDKPLDVAKFPPLPLEPEGQGTQSQVIRTGQPLYIPDYQQAVSGNVSRHSINEDGTITPGPPSEPDAPVTQSALLAPMKIKGDVIGVLQVQSYRPDAYSEDDQMLLVGLANTAALAIQNARLVAQLEMYSQTLENAVTLRTAELHSALARAETILANNPDGILLLTGNGLIEQCNPAIRNLIGSRKGDLHNASPVELLPEDSEHREGMAAALKAALATGEVRRLETAIRSADGRIIEMLAALAPIQENGETKGAVLTLHDISEQKTVDRLKDQFVSNVSHELRTPIATMKINHELLARNPDRTPVYVQRLERETLRLEQIVEGVLALSRLDQGRQAAQMAPLDLNALAEQTVADCTTLAESRGVRLSFRAGRDAPAACGDSGMLAKALNILLNNALNYTPGGGRVTVRTLKRGNGRGGAAQVGFSVNDNGPGIPSDEMPHLFERFFRGSAGRASSSHGTGLGLAIVREIVERHHGKIKVESSGIPGEGAKFAVLLPTNVNCGGEINHE